MTPSPCLPPIERSVDVPWETPFAFERFTLKFGEWWPYRTHSVGEQRVKRVVFEARAGGLIFEEHQDGRRFQWGQVVEIAPPNLLRFTWHPSRAAETAQDVTVRFEPSNGKTRVTLVASSWERWGAGAARARRGYNVGWGYVLNVWAGRRTWGMALLDRVAGAMAMIEKLRGGLESQIARAGGELPPSAAR